MKESIIVIANNIMLIYSSRYASIATVQKLKETIEDAFNEMIFHNFIPECKGTIRDEIVNVIKDELKKAFSAYNYDCSDVTLDLSGLDAHITEDGAKALSDKFTGNNEGHIIQDAIRASYGIFTMDVNQAKERDYNTRVEHYNFYKKKIL